MKTPVLLLTALALSPCSWALAQQAPPAPAPQPLTPVAAPAPVNLALNKKYVSSDPNLSNWDSGLTDGSWDTVRGHTFATGNLDTFPKTVTIDLETPATLGYVGVGVPGFGSTKTIKLSLGTDETTFTEVGSYTFVQKKEEKYLFKFAPTKARYIRLTYTDHYTEQADYPVTHAFTTEVTAYTPGVEPVLPPTYPPLPFQPADVPAPKLARDGSIDAGFARQHQSFLDRIKQGPIDLLFVGDSITNGWRNNSAQPIWNQHYGALNAANFGIGGDRTQHVLWRFDNGELDGIHPKVVVVMIGTNNIGYKTEEIIQGDQKIVSEIHRRLPDAKVLLLGIFPRAASPTDPMRAKIKAVNAELSKLDDGNKTRYLDFGDKFLTPTGELTKDIMPDFLHPNAAGYQIWADAMQPLLDEMMK